jgi:hypothetical protein
MKMYFLLLFLVFIDSAYATDLNCAENVSAKYAGPIFDAMAQIESGKYGTVISALNESGVYRMALFARLHKKTEW